MELGGEQNANIMQLQRRVVELERGLAEVKEMVNASKKVRNWFPHVQVTPQNANIMQLQSRVVELERGLEEVKEMVNASKKVGNVFPQVQVTPRMPPSCTPAMHLGWGWP